MLTDSYMRALLVGMDMSSQAQVGSSTVDVAAKQALGLEHTVGMESSHLYYNHQECRQSPHRQPTELLKNFHTLHTATCCSAHKRMPHNIQIPDYRQKSVKPHHFRSMADRN